MLSGLHSLVKGFLLYSKFSPVNSEDWRDLEPSVWFSIWGTRPKDVALSEKKFKIGFT